MYFPVNNTNYMYSICISINIFFLFLKLGIALSTFGFLKLYFFIYNVTYLFIYFQKSFVLYTILFFKFQLSGIFYFAFHFVIHWYSFAFHFSSLRHLWLQCYSQQCFFISPLIFPSISHFYLLFLLIQLQYLITVIFSASFFLNVMIFFSV